MRRRLVHLVFAVSFLGLTACSAKTDWPKATRTVTPPIPVYPNMRPEGARATSGVPGVVGVNGSVTSFVTADPAETVVAFYQSRLVKDGWDPDGARSYVNRAACPLYHLYISTSVSNGSMTQVELRLTEEPCVNR